MRLKPRKTRHPNRVGWTRVKTSPSQGWGLNQWHPHIPKWNYRNGIVAVLLFLTVSWFAGFYDLPGRASAQCTVERLPGAPCRDPTTLIWQRPKVQPSNLNDFVLASPLSNSYTYTSNCFGGTDDCLSEAAAVNGIALAQTNATIGELGVGQSKTLAIAASWIPSGTFAVGSRTANNWGYYITTNATVPSVVTGYDPFNDKSVVFGVRQWCSANCGSAVSANSLNTEVFVQRKMGNSLFSEDQGLASCGSAGSCFIGLGPGSCCITGGTETFLDTYLNYTGTTNPVTSCTITGGTVLQGPGCSWVVTEPYNAASFVVGTDAQPSQNIPPDPFSTGNFYLGFYSSVQGSVSISWVFDPGTAIILGGNTGMDVFTYVPNPACNVPSSTNGNVCSSLDSPSFVGQLWNGVLNIGLFIPSIIAGVPLASLKSSANNLGTAFLAQLFQFFNYMVDFLKSILNGVGSVLGISNLGDNIFSFLTGIISMFGQLASSITNWLTSLVNRALDLITIVTTFSSTFFTGLNEFLSEMKVIATGIVTIFSKLFLYGGAFYFLYDIILYFQLTGDAGFEGVGTWIGFNKWASFAVFGIITRILNALLQGFDWILSHIPWLSPRMPETGLPAIPQLAAGDFPGLRIPTGHVQKLREGDPAAFLLWAVGGFLILPFYLGSSISPLAGLTAAVGCGPTTCFNNALTTVGYPFAGLFLLLFVGVTITEMLHGVTMESGQRIVIQNKLPAGFGRFGKEATGKFQFGTKHFVNLRKGGAKKAAKRKEQVSPEQRYENRYGGLPGE